MATGCSNYYGGDLMILEVLVVAITCDNATVYEEKIFVTGYIGLGLELMNLLIWWDWCLNLDNISSTFNLALYIYIYIYICSY